MTDEKLSLLVLSLQATLGRLPTETEVISFLYGDEKTRKAIWNDADLKETK